MLEKLGLKLVKLDLPFRLNHVNCFIAEGEKGLKIIDAGLHNDQTVKRWEQEIDGREVTDLLITHYHPDHFGYAGGLQEKTGAQVTMSEIDANAGMNAWTDNLFNQLHESYKLTGIPDEMGAQMINNTKEFVDVITPYPIVNHHFLEGERIAIGKFEYEVIFTPGHSDGLVSFYNEESSTLLSTDHVLPKITPNISYWFHGDPNPLATYIQSLDKVRKLDADFVVPSHGQPFHGANDRIDAIKAHHNDRLVQTVEAIGTGSTVNDICKMLFQKTLTVHEMRFAIGETLAHLEYLRLQGTCKREDRNGLWWYFI